MAKAERIEVFPIAEEKFYRAIVDYSSYPQFVANMAQVDILKQTETSAQIKFYLNLIKKFTYTLTMRHEPPTKVSWTLKEGELFKKNTGHWIFRGLEKDQTEVTYALDVELKVFLPKLIAKKLVHSNVPQTMASFFERAKRMDMDKEMVDDGG